MGSYLKEPIMIRVLCLLIVASLLSVEGKPDPCSGGGCRGQYGCYCMDLTFQDHFGNVNGNCLSTDPSGFRWCYVSEWSSCYHKQRSQRYYNTYYSYEPCRRQPPVDGRIQQNVINSNNM